MPHSSPALEVQGSSVTAGAAAIRTVSPQARPGTAPASRASVRDGKKSLVVVGRSLSSKSKKAPTTADDAPGLVRAPPATACGQKETSPAISAPMATANDSKSSRAVAAAARSKKTAASRRDNSVEMSLVRNLKEQIACLEAQLRVQRQQQEAAARTHTRRATKNHDSANATTVHAGQDVKYSTRLTLPMPHETRVSPSDAAAGALEEEDACAEEVARLRGIPDAYQIERSALQHNVESLTKDIEGLQRMVLDVGHERDVMASEVVQYRSQLRTSREEAKAAAAECAATLRLLEAERALRRAADDNAEESSRSVHSGHLSGAALATVDAVSQRDYYKLQCDRLKEAVTREKARAESLAGFLTDERGRSTALETQLCSALDRVALMEQREQQLATYYQSLSARFVTVSAMLRHVLDSLPDDLLQQQRIPSPERAADGAAAAGGEGGDGEGEVTLGEVRETMDAWQQEVLANAHQLSQTPQQEEKSSRGSPDAGLAGAVHRDVEVDAPPLQDQRSEDSSPNPNTAMREKAATPDAVVEGTSAVDAPAASAKAVTPAESSPEATTCAVPAEVEEGEPAADSADAPAVTVAEVAAVVVLETQVVEELPELTAALAPVAAHEDVEDDTIVPATAGAGEPTVPSAAEEATDADAVAESAADGQEEEEVTSAPDQATLAAAAAPSSPALAVPVVAVPPPPLVPAVPVVCVPAPPPAAVPTLPMGVAVPLPPSGFAVPAPPPPPGVVVPSGALPAAPIPPTLEQQLSALDERIEAQERMLVEMVAKQKAEA